MDPHLSPKKKKGGGASERITECTQSSDGNTHTHTHIPSPPPHMFLIHRSTRSSLRSAESPTSRLILPTSGGSSFSAVSQKHT